MPSLKLMAALGNPGPQYEKTRHNLGFLLADLLLGLASERKSMRLARLPASDDCELYSMHLLGSPLLLIKPLTYMNRSGDAVARIAGREGIRPEEILVAHDDLDLDLGRLKLKLGGGSGGHKGVDSIAERLGTTSFWRLRLGISHPPRAGEDGFVPVERYVLEPFGPEESERLPEVLALARKGLETLIKRGPQAAMQLLHATPREEPAEENKDPQT